MELKTLAKKSYVQFLILFLLLGLYLITLNPVFGALTALAIISMVVLEILEGKEKHGWKNEIKDTGIALVAALVIWFGAQFLLNTNAPISAVVTCSMLPELQRGDFAIVQGAEPKAYEIEMSKSEIAELLKPEAKLFIEDKNATVKGSAYSYCSFIGLQPSSEDNALCSGFLYQDPSKFQESKGELRFNYGICERKIRGGSSVKEACVKSVDFKGKNYPLPQQNSNDIIVYQPAKDEIYSLSGDIIHRAYFKIKVTGTEEIYYLTKGDNNPILDIQVYDYGRGMGNYPISKEKLKGKMLFKVPLLGYFKLFISGFFTEPAQCKWQLS